jgi:hypothetical protein
MTDIVALQAGIYAWVVGGTQLAPENVSWEGQNQGRSPEPSISMRLHNILSPGQDWFDIEENPMTFSAVTVVSVAAGVLQTATPHGLALGDGPIVVTSTGTLPSPLTPGQNVWAIPVDTTHLRVATTFLRARAGTAVALADAGTGTVLVTATDDTRRAGQELLVHARGPRELVVTLECYTKVGVGMGMAQAVLMRLSGRRKLPTQRDALKAAGLGLLNIESVRAIHGQVNSSVFEPRARVDVHFSIASDETETLTYIERADIETIVSEDGVQSPILDEIQHLPTNDT